MSLTVPKGHVLVRAVGFEGTETVAYIQGVSQGRQGIEEGATRQPLETLPIRP